MRLFLSHSSDQKALVSSVRRALPESIRAWVDEKNLLIGDTLDVTLRDTIQKATDYVVVFIDEPAARSPWVRREVQWALEHERTLSRQFLLPVVLKPRAWKALVRQVPELSGRKFVQLYERTEEAVDNLARQLTLQLFALVVREREARREPVEQNESPVSILERTDRLLANLADAIIGIVLHHGRDEAVPTRVLLEKLRLHPEFQAVRDVAELDQLVTRLRHQGRLAGLARVSDELFVVEEHYGWKTRLFRDAKERIAKRAIMFIESGQTIALDAGSTTLEIAREIGRRVKQYSLSRITIVTNSVPAAYELLLAANEIGLEDKNDILDVCVPGGRIRSNTLAIVDRDKNPGAANEFDDIIKAIGKVDVAFVGTNGIHKDHGFTTHALSEVRTKATQLENAARRFVVADPSKFGHRQENKFAGFDEEITILTVHTDQNAAAVEEFEKFAADQKTYLDFAD